MGTVLVNHMCTTKYILQLTSPDRLTAEQINIARQACAGLLWSKQIFIFHVNKWIKGNPIMYKICITSKFLVN